MDADESAKPLEIRVEDQVRVAEGLGIHKRGPASEGVALVEPDWKANAESERGTIARSQSEGRPSKGETDTLACARRFVGFRRAQGEMWWGEPVKVKEEDRGWVDCEAFDQRNPKAARLLMQVQRAMVGDELYAEWAREGHVGLPPGTTAEEAAALIQKAIENKVERTSPSPDVILLLDAVRLPWLALEVVAAEVRRAFAAPGAKKHFQAIYVVPWAESAIRRLDPPE